MKLLIMQFPPEKSHRQMDIYLLAVFHLQTQFSLWAGKIHLRFLAYNFPSKSGN
jgi:hypothetical protein